MSESENLDELYADLAAAGTGASEEERADAAKKHEKEWKQLTEQLGQSALVGEIQSNSLSHAEFEELTRQQGYEQPAELVQPLLQNDDFDINNVPDLKPPTQPLVGSN